MKKNTNSQTVKKMFSGWTFWLTLGVLIVFLVSANAYFSVTDFDYSKTGLIIPTNWHYLDAKIGFWLGLIGLTGEFFLVKYLDVPGR